MANDDRSVGALMTRSIFLIIAFAVLASFQGASAHDARPAYMQVTEVAPQRYEVIWRTPVLSGMRLPVVLRFPANTRNVIEPVLRELSDSLVEHRIIERLPPIALCCQVRADLRRRCRFELCCRLHWRGFEVRPHHAAGG